MEADAVQIAQPAPVNAMSSTRSPLQFQIDIHPVAAERVKALGDAVGTLAELAGSGAAVLGVVEDDALIKLTQFGVHAKISSALCTPRTRTSISARVL